MVWTKKFCNCSIRPTLYSTTAAWLARTVRTSWSASVKPPSTLLIASRTPKIRSPQTIGTARTERVGMAVIRSTPLG